jgi:hypothetical protein
VQDRVVVTLPVLDEAAVVQRVEQSLSEDLERLVELIGRDTVVWMNVESCDEGCLVEDGRCRLEDRDDGVLEANRKVLAEDGEWKEDGLSECVDDSAEFELDEVITTGEVAD